MSHDGEGGPWILSSGDFGDESHLKSFQTAYASPILTKYWSMSMGGRLIEIRGRKWGMSAAPPYPRAYKSRRRTAQPLDA